MNKILEIKNLSIGYQKPIQKDINLDLFEGQFICLIGPNGVGKSTLLKTISRIIPAISGEVIIKDKLVKSINNNDLSKIVGLVLTDHIEGFQLKATDVIQMGRYPHTGFWGKLSKKDFDIIEEAIDQIEIDNLVDRYFNELSDGEKQKVLIVKALVQQAPLMLLDEPTAFLDFPTKANLLILLRKLARTNKLGIVISTHDIELALKTADHIWLLSDEKEIIKGTPEDLVLQGHINQVFKNKELQFNQESGHFEREFNSNKTVKLIGRSTEIFWLSKALNRNDIEINSNSEVSIDFDDKYIISKHQKPLTNCSNIEEVLFELNKIL